MKKIFMVTIMASFKNIRIIFFVNGPSIFNCLNYKLMFIHLHNNVFLI